MMAAIKLGRQSSTPILRAVSFPGIVCTGVLTLHAAFLVLLLTPPAAAQWNDEEAQTDCESKGKCENVNIPVTTECLCSDLAPQAYAGAATNGTCLEQVALGNCDMPWMQLLSTSNIGNDGYCDISCGRCNCCKTYYSVLQNIGANTFLQVASAAGFGLNLTQPGFSFTVLAPTDAAFSAYLARTPGLTLDRLLGNRAALRRIVNYHILPNVPVIDAFWTTPFLLPGTVLSTLLGPAATIRVGPGLRFNGAARYTTSDMFSCKGNVIGIDTVLTPPAAARARRAAGPAAEVDPSIAVTDAAQYDVLETPAAISNAAAMAAPVAQEPERARQTGGKVLSGPEPNAPAVGTAEGGTTVADAAARGNK